MGGYIHGWGWLLGGAYGITWYTVFVMLDAVVFERPFAFRHLMFSWRINLSVLFGSCLEFQHAPLFVYLAFERLCI